MQSVSGTYVIILRSDTNRTIQIGRRGLLTLQPGYYLYTGSAFGPGGLKARVARHLRTEKKLRWHIDYLRAYTVPISVWCSYAKENLEHQWAQAIHAIPEMSPVKGFGCSDCRCVTHLFYTAVKPELAHMLNDAVKIWPED